MMLSSEKESLFGLFKNLMLTSSAQYFMMASGLFCMFITLARFGLVGRGEYATAYALVNMLGLYASWSLGRSSVRFIASSKLSNSVLFFRENLWSYIVFYFSIMLVATVLFFITILLFPHIIGKLSIGLISISLISLPYTMWQYVGRFFYAQINKIHCQNNIVVLNRVLLMLNVYYFIVIRQDSLLALFVIFALFNFLSFLFEAIFLYKFVNPIFKLNFSFIKPLLKEGGIIHFDSIFVYLLFSVNVIIINLVLGLRDAGMYSIVVQLHSLLFIIPTAAQILFQKNVSSGFENARSEIKFYFLLSVFAALLSIPFVYILLHILEHYSLKITNDDVELMFKLYLSILPAYMVMSFLQIFNPLLVYINAIKKLMFFTVVLGVINVLALYYLAGRFGLYMTSFITFIIYLIMLFVYICLWNGRNKK